jgi:hypothetical protein
MITEQEIEQLAKEYVKERYNNANPALKEILLEDFKLIYARAFLDCLNKIKNEYKT